MSTNPLFPTHSRKTDRQQRLFRQQAEELLIEGRRTFGSKQNLSTGHFLAPHALLSVPPKEASPYGTSIGNARVLSSSAKHCHLRHLLSERCAEEAILPHMPWLFYAKIIFLQDIPKPDGLISTVRLRTWPCRISFGQFIRMKHSPNIKDNSKKSQYIALKSVFLCSFANDNNTMPVV